MPITITELSDDLVEVKLSGKLHKNDYDEFVPGIEAAIARAKQNVKGKAARVEAMAEEAEEAVNT